MRRRGGRRGRCWAGPKREERCDGCKKAFGERHDRLLNLGASFTGSSLRSDEGSWRLADALGIRQSPGDFTERGVPLEPELPGPDLDAPSLLGRAGLRPPPAV